MRSRLPSGTVAILLIIAVIYCSQFGTQHAKAQEPILEEELPLVRSMSLEHLNGTTRELDSTFKVGNLPLGNGLSAYGLSNTISNTVYYRGYLYFDLSRIPRESDLLEAKVVLNVQRFDYGYAVSPSPGVTLTYGMYPVTESWPPTSTWQWNDLPLVLTDTVPHTELVFGQTGRYTVELTSLVQGWVDGTPNHGVMLGMYPNPDDVADFIAVIDRYNEALKPRLILTYREPPLKSVYLPLVLNPGQPDLVITAIKPNPLEISITNRGTTVAGTFWLDLGVDPESLPTVNQVWHQWGSDYGAAWEVPVLASGQSLTLTIGDIHYKAEQSRWPTEFSKDEHLIWAYIDSWGPPNAWGGVKESVEDNNRYGPVTFVGTETQVNLKPQVLTPIPPRGQTFAGGAR